MNSAISLLALQHHVNAISDTLMHLMFFIIKLSARQFLTVMSSSYLFQMATSDLVDLTECHNNIHFVPQSSQRKRQDWLPILMDYRTRIRVFVLLGEKVQFPYAGHDS